MTTRRAFLRQSALGIAGAVALPTLLGARAWDDAAPPARPRLRIGQIGCGRIARSMDLPGFLDQSDAQVVAVCDVDSRRVEDARTLVEVHYAKHGSPGPVTTHRDYRELLARPDIDVVAISTPDHWHALPVIEAALAGKDIYVQKPLALTISESEAARRVVRAKGRILQMGSQQRSSPQFHRACELVRNGRIGTVHTIRIGLPNDPAGPVVAAQAVPATLDYDRWLGPVATDMPYIEERVHPQKDYSRPGWLRVEEFSAGMITGWGSHHIDIAHWAMGWERSGPQAITATASFPSSGIWSVHTAYHVEAEYPGGVRMIIDGTFPNGIRFEGSDGWIFVSRGGEKTTSSDPASVADKALAASDEKILGSVIAPGEIQLHRSTQHFADFLKAIRTRTDPVAHVDAGSYTFNAIAAMWIAMKLGRPLRYDAATASFPGDEQANRLRARPQRAAYSIDAVLAKAGMTP